MRSQDRSGAARQYDEWMEQFLDAVRHLGLLAKQLREALDNGEVPSSRVAATEIFLTRFKHDPDVYMKNVNDGGSTYEQVFGSEDHCIDGSIVHLGEKIAPHLRVRNTTRSQLIDNWPRLTEAERSTRFHPDEAPTS